MKKIVTTIWCAILATAGYFLTSSTHENIDTPQSTMYAATLPNWNNNGQLPLDLFLDQVKTINDDVNDVEIHDTVFVETKKYVPVPAPKNTTDTLYMPLYVPTPIDGVPVNNKNPGSTKKSTVILTIDGNIVYTTDGLQEP